MSHFIKPQKQTFIFSANAHMVGSKYN